MKLVNSQTLSVVRDARTVIGGVLGLLTIGFLLLRPQGTDRLLGNFLRSLPAHVQGVIFETERSAALSPIVARLFSVPDVRVQLPVRPVATLLVKTEAGSEALAVVERTRAARAGIVGPVHSGFVVVGETATSARLWTDGDGKEHRGVTPEVTQFLSHAPRAALRVLVRAPWLADRFPALGLSPRPGEVLGLAIEATAGQLHISGLVSRGTDRRVLPTALLQSPPSGALFVVDSVAASALLPEDLPPVISALLQDTGVTAELLSIARLLGDQPVALVIRAPADGLPDIVLGIRRNPTPPRGSAGPAARERDNELRAALRALLERRLALAGARTEVVRINGRVIRHQRPGVSPREALREVTDGPWRLLEAPRAAGTKDLVVAETDDMRLVGTSRDSVLAVGTAALAGRSAANHDQVSVFLDGALMRREPLVAHALQSVPDEFRPWLETMGTFQLDVFPGRRSLRFSGSATFE